MKKVDYNERAYFYDLEVSKDNRIVNFLEQISKKINIEIVVKAE